ncbi:MAG TPA: alpha/beta fold hydrolase [Acidimicrobiia bacterium]|nr:alpha/beta fold hydrolase [Acidimicrobiia bacterium]
MDHVTITTSDGVRLSVRRWKPAGAPRAHVVLVHGFSASTTDRRVLAVAGALTTAGFDVFAYDSRGHGRSGGATTLGNLERHDVAAAVEAVRATSTTGPVVVVGASMGAIAALHFSTVAERPVDGLVIVSCPARWRLPRNARGVISAVMTHTPFGRRFALRRMGVRVAPPSARSAPPVELVARVHVPVAIIHGLDDPFIAPADAEALFAASNEPHRVELVDGLAHAFDPADVAAAPIVDAVDWVLSVLGTLNAE